MALCCSHLNFFCFISSLRSAIFKSELQYKINVYTYNVQTFYVITLVSDDYQPDNFRKVYLKAAKIPETVQAGSRNILLHNKKALYICILKFQTGKVSDPSHGQSKL